MDEEQIQVMTERCSASVNSVSGIRDLEIFTGISKRGIHGRRGIAGMPTAWMASWGLANP